MDQTKSLIIQIVTTLIFLLLSVPALMNVIAGVMSMAAIGSSGAWQIISGVVTLLSLLYPLAAIVCIIISWVLYAKTNYAQALWVSLIPGAWAMVIIALMGVLFAISDNSA